MSPSTSLKVFLFGKSLLIVFVTMMDNPKDRQMDGCLHKAKQSVHVLLWKGGQSNPWWGSSVYTGTLLDSTTLILIQFNGRRMHIEAAYITWGSGVAPCAACRDLMWLRLETLQHIILQISSLQHHQFFSEAATVKTVSFAKLLFFRYAFSMDLSNGEQNPF